MSKKAKKKSARVPAAAPPRTSRFKLIVALLLPACALLTISFAATRFNPVRRAVGMLPLLEPATQVQGPLPLSKEYIYAGGKLVATEEPTPAATPTPTPAGPPPTNLVATASLPTIDTAAVKLTWAAPSSGTTPTSYIVERAVTRTENGLDYTALGQTAASAPTDAAPYLDQSAVQGQVYLYRVKAVYAGGYSGYSNQDLATTYRYTGDDPLIGSGDPDHRPASVVRAANLTELRAVVDAVRALAGVGHTTWKSDPSPLYGGQILMAHFLELRTNLNPALAALGIAALPDDPTLQAGQRVKKEHVQDVRDKVK